MDPRDYDNVAYQKHFFCLKKRKTWVNQVERTLCINKPDPEIGDNAVYTAKYNFINFLPRNIFEQFSRLANVYFLVIFI